MQTWKQVLCSQSEVGSLHNPPWVSLNFIPTPFTAQSDDRFVREIRVTVLHFLSWISISLCMYLHLALLRLCETLYTLICLLSLINVLGYADILKALTNIWKAMTNMLTAMTNIWKAIKNLVNSQLRLLHF